MKMILSIVFLFAFSFSAMSGVTVAGQVPTVTIGGVTLPLSQALIFNGSASTASNYDSFKQNGVVYQVPAGKTLVCLAQKVASVSTVQFGFYLGSGTAPVSNSPSAPAGAVNINFGPYPPIITGAAAGAVAEGQMYFEVGPGRYPYIQGSNTGTGSVLCYLK